MTASIQSEREYVALDLETTGLMAETDRIVEIGAVRFLADSREIGPFQRLVNPLRPMSPGGVAAVPGISRRRPRRCRTRDRSITRISLVFGRRGHDRAHGTQRRVRCRLPGPRVGARPVCPLRPTPSSILSPCAPPKIARPRQPSAQPSRPSSEPRPLRCSPPPADSLRVKAIWLANPGQLRNRAITSSPFACSTPRVRHRPPKVGEPLVKAAATGVMVRIEYDGGTRGTTPRLITPRHFIRAAAQLIWSPFAIWTPLISRSASIASALSRSSASPTPNGSRLNNRPRAARLSVPINTLLRDPGSCSPQSLSPRWLSFAGHL